jgi:hypothetical protein
MIFQGGRLSSGRTKWSKRKYIINEKYRYNTFNSLSIGHQGSAGTSAADGRRSFELEADPLAYIFGGYSAHAGYNYHHVNQLLVLQ